MRACARERRQACVSMQACESPTVPMDGGAFVCVGKLGGVGEAAEGFQSTHPVWGETAMNYIQHHITSISIHSPRVG